MNKTAIKNFAIWARNKLIADVRYRAGLAGITEQGIQTALPQSDSTTEFYDIGTATPYPISGPAAVRQRRNLAEAIRRRVPDSGYPAAYRHIMEEAAYTWFNRLIAVRFMEVNDYLPGRVRALSSGSGRIEPDLVTTPFDAGLSFTAEEEQAVLQLKQGNKLDELFRLLFIKQCNALAAVLPALFKQHDDYTELLLNLSVVDQEGVVWRLIHDIPEDDFNVERGGQVEIIGWLYQYYNTEPKAQVFARPSGQKVEKEDVPAVTQLFTPDWIVRYMVENSLGRLWLEGHPDDGLRSSWKYYLDEAEQEPEAAAQLEAIRAGRRNLAPEDIRFIDPCMGSGHILVYAFDVLMRLYEKAGWEPRGAARSIVEKNLYGLDIDKRAYQLAYFAVMMKARQYDRRFLTRGVEPQVYYPGENKELEEFGSLLVVEKWDKPEAAQTSLSDMADNFRRLLAGNYDVVVTNPPYMAVSNASGEVQAYVKKNFPDSKADLFAVFIQRCGQLVKQDGYQAMITQHAWMFLSSFKKLRAKLREADTVNMAHLGARAFEEIGGEVVQTTSFVLRKSCIQGYKGIYCRLVEPVTQQGKEAMFLSGKNRYAVPQENFSKIPGSPVAYWVSAGLMNTFSNYKAIKDIGKSLQGTITGDNERFMRLWFEIDAAKLKIDARSCEETAGYKWIPYSKGGDFRRWYGNLIHVINWENNGYEIKNCKNANGKLRSRPQNTSYFFKRAITWSSLTAGHFGARILVEGSSFSDIGPIIFLNNEMYIYHVLGYVNSKVFQALLDICCTGLHYQNGVIANLPGFDYSQCVDETEDYVKENIALSKADWDSFELSWDFKEHPLCTSARLASRNGTRITVQQAFEDWVKVTEERFRRLKANEEKLNRIFIGIYGLHSELDPAVDDRDVTVRRADLARDIRSLLSYAVGCMFGRYSLDIPDSCCAGDRWDTGGILPLTDGEYLEDDVLSRLCSWLRTVYGPDTLEENLDFIARALGNKGSTSREIIRNYFLKDFFADHCRLYQKRPIYWLFDSGKQNGFKALIYLHRYTPDTIGRLRVNYLHRLQRVYASEIERMQDMASNNTNQREAATAARRKEKLQKQLKECREYDERIAHLALARIELDLDDGVKVNYEKLQTAADGKKYPVLGKI